VKADLGHRRGGRVHLVAWDRAGKADLNVVAPGAGVAIAPCSVLGLRRSNAAMDASVAVVLGAAVGAIGGLGGGVLSTLGQARQMRHQHDRDRERWRDEIRRDAYVSLLASTKQLSNALWKVADQLDAVGSTAVEWQARYEEAHNAWTQFSAAASAVGVAGPRQVADAAAALRQAMYDWEMISTDWTHEAIRGGSGRLTSFESRFRVAAEAKHPPDRALQVAARKALGTD